MFDTIDMTFICGVGADDWNDEVSADERFNKIMEQVSDGTVILLHDMTGNSRTVEAIGRIIPAMISEGYEFVTVSELFSQKNIVPRKTSIYTNVFQEW